MPGKERRNIHLEWDLETSDPHGRACDPAVVGSNPILAKDFFAIENKV